MDKNTTACSQICHNTVGSFRCECEKGFFLEEDGKTCTKGERGESLCWDVSFFFFRWGWPHIIPVSIRLKRRWGVLQTETPGNHYTSQLLCMSEQLSLPNLTPPPPPSTPTDSWSSLIFWMHSRPKFQTINFFLCPRFSCQWSRQGCRFATSSHEFVFHNLR